MKAKLKQIALVFTVGILFPYMAVLLAMQNGIAVSGQEDGGRRIILQDGRQMDSERYLAGILAKQIDSEYPSEVLKAQAVLARTWLYQAMGEKDTISEEQLGEYAWERDWMPDIYGSGYLEAYHRYYRAVFATQKETAWYENIRITPLYHMLSAGRTRDDNSGNCPYLIGRECSSDMEAEQFLRVKIMEPAQFREVFNRIDPARQMGEEAALTDMEWKTDSAGYITQVVINGMEFSSQEVQHAFEMPSSWIRAEEYGTQIRLISRGIGHGYGLSQWEAKRLAENGYDYQQILGHFFHGISIKAE